MDTLKARLAALYQGDTVGARRLRYALILFDLLTVVYFIATTPLPETPLTQTIDYTLLLVIALDFVGRLWIAPDKLRHLTRIFVLADLIVMLSFLLDPFLAADLAFLRILRGIRLGRSEYLLRDLRRSWRFFRSHEDALVAALNLTIFVFVTTCAVFEFFLDEAAVGYPGFVDALYFTVTTLTTTGYGDLTPTNIPGKLTSVGIMVIGVSLFLRLAATVFSPGKVNHTCAHCGLTRHDIDAVHCKHCGERVEIETKGSA